MNSETAGNTLGERLKKTIQDVPDFPIPGVLFRDLTPVLRDPDLCREITHYTAAQFRHLHIDAVIGLESRGFWFGPMIAGALNAAFIPVRKAGKLPGKTMRFEYALEYGSAVIEMREYALKNCNSILIHDDVLATGGTAAAAAELVKMAGKKVAGFSFLVELDFLKGREKILPFANHIDSLVHY